MKLIPYTCISSQNGPSLTVALRTAVFGAPVNTAFPHMLRKFHTQVTQGQLTRSRQVTSSQKKSLNGYHIATPNDRSP